LNFKWILALSDVADRITVFAGMLQRYIDAALCVDDGVKTATVNVKAELIEENKK